MSLIVAGNFASKTQADSAIEVLLSAGIQSDHICSFRVNPPGQHDAYPLGGDEYASPDVLRQRGARDVEETEGTWREGTWVDFDPTREKPASERNDG